MKLLCLVLVLALTALTACPAADAESKHWAVLVAGSSGWDNYRHQADICHAYQILHKHGIPDERIIVFMEDDIAYNKQNPTPGIIINHPNGSDVYHGVPKDYTHKNNAPEHFLSVLTGDKEAMRGIGSGRVLESGPDDHVFIYFADHGAPGFVAFPRQVLSAKQLNNALEKMHTKKMYKQLVFYMEACESGSMFDGDLLPKNRSVYAVTAANGEESSYAIYRDNLRGTYLGDVFSVKWMEDTDRVGTSQDLFSQFTAVKEAVTTSHVMKFGDLSFDLEAIQQFMGSVEGNVIDEHLHHTAMNQHDKPVPSPDVPIAILYNRMLAVSNEGEKAQLRTELAKELTLRNKITDVTRQIATAASPANSDDLVKEVMTNKAHPRNFDCAEAVVKAYTEQCFGIKQYEFVMRQINALVNMCEHQSFTKTAILSSIASVCKH